MSRPTVKEVITQLQQIVDQYGGDPVLRFFNHDETELFLSGGFRAVTGIGQRRRVECVLLSDYELEKCCEVEEEDDE